MVWPWLAPATGTLLLLLATWGPPAARPEPYGGPGIELIAAVGLSNYAAAPAVVGDTLSRQNAAERFWYGQRPGGAIQVWPPVRY